MSVFTQLGTTWFVARRPWTRVIKRGTKTFNSELLCNITEKRIEGDVARFTIRESNLSWNKLSFCLFLKVVAKNRTIPLTFCNLRQPDLCLIRGRLDAEHCFSTRSAVMLQNKLQSFPALFSVAFRHLLQTSLPSAGKIHCMYRFCCKR